MATANSRRDMPIHVDQRLHHLGAQRRRHHHPTDFVLRRGSADARRVVVTPAAVRVLYLHRGTD